MEKVRGLGVSPPNQEVSYTAECGLQRQVAAVLGTAAQLHAFSGRMKINYVGCI